MVIDTCKTAMSGTKSVLRIEDKVISMFGKEVPGLPFPNDSFPKMRMFFVLLIHVLLSLSKVHIFNILTSIMQGHG